MPSVYGLHLAIEPLAETDFVDSHLPDVERRQRDFLKKGAKAVFPTAVRGDFPDEEVA